MPARLDDANYWHKRAAEAAAVASLLHTVAAKQVADGIAESYERIARMIESDGTGKARAAAG